VQIEVLLCPFILFFPVLFPSVPSSILPLSSQHLILLTSVPFPRFLPLFFNASFLSLLVFFSPLSLALLSTLLASFGSDFLLFFDTLAAAKA